MIFKRLLRIGFSAIRIFLCLLNDNCSRKTSHCALATWILYTVVFLVSTVFVLRGTRWCSWLRHCATNGNVAGSIPDGVIGIFHWHNPSGRTMALGSTQPLTEMSTRNISWGVKAAGAYGWQPYHLHVLTGSLTLLETSGPAEACNGIALPLTL